jgi:hypothetical protein
MFLSTNQLYNLIKANDYKSARIFEGQNVDYTNEMPFESIFKSSKEDLILRIKELETFLNGDFTIILGTGRKSEPIKQGKKMNVRFIQKMEIIKPEESRMNGFETFENSDSINAKVQSEVARILLEKEKEKELNEYKDKIAELDQWSGKLNYLLTQFLNNYLKSLQAVPQMNGTETQPPMNGQEINANELDHALGTLINFIGHENIIKFSEKIKNGQAEAVKPLIIQFINQ